LLVHAFWFASKLAMATFVQASIPLFAIPTWEYPLAQKERPAGWKFLPFPTVAYLRCRQGQMEEGKSGREKHILRGSALD
jgi:hypothetical protein